MDKTIGGTKMEIITPEEFMARLRIKRSTFNTWKKSGKLIRERHYIQVRAVIRIFWSIELLRELDDPPSDKRKRSATKKKSAAKRTPRRGCRVNLNI